MKKYLLIFGGFCACLFISGEIYSFVYDVEPNSHILEEYLSDMTEREGEPISLQEWMNKQDEKAANFLDIFADGCDCALNPFYNPAGYGHRE